MHIDIHNKIGECMYLDKMNNTSPTENMSEIRCSTGMKFLIHWWYRTGRVFPSEKCDDKSRKGLTDV